MSRHKMVGNGHVSKDSRKVQVLRERQTFRLSWTHNIFMQWNVLLINEIIVDMSSCSCGCVGTEMDPQVLS